MNHRWRSWLVASVIALAVAGWVAIDAATDEASAPPVSSIAARAPVVTFEPRVETTDASVVAAARPVLTTTFGRSLGTDDLGIAAFLTKATPAARQGDAMAAYRVYQAEAACASLDRDARMDMSLANDEERARHAAGVEQLTAACAGVTPAQIGERFVFLNQAVRAGNEQAMIDYAIEGPNGHEVTDFDPRDPLLLEWKQDSIAYLQRLAEKGDQIAWVLLAQDYENGIVVDRDLGAAITWWTALQISRKPDTDPLSINFINDIAKQLPADDVQQAIAQGRVLGTQFPRKRRAV